MLGSFKSGDGFINIVIFSQISHISFFSRVTDSMGILRLGTRLGLHNVGSMREWLSI